jgi:hypothetical protein
MWVVTKESDSRFKFLNGDYKEDAAQVYTFYELPLKDKKIVWNEISKSEEFLDPDDQHATDSESSDDQHATDSESSDDQHATDSESSDDQHATDSESSDDDSAPTQPRKIIRLSPISSPSTSDESSRGATPSAINDNSEEEAPTKPASPAKKESSSEEKSSGEEIPPADQVAKKHDSNKAFAQMEIMFVEPDATKQILETETPVVKPLGIEIEELVNKTLSVDVNENSAEIRDSNQNQNPNDIMDLSSEYPPITSPEQPNQQQKVSNQRSTMKGQPFVLTSLSDNEKEFFNDQLNIIKSEESSEKLKTSQMEQRCEIIHRFKDKEVLLTIVGFRSANLRKIDTLYVKKITSKADNRIYGTIDTMVSDGNETWTISLRLSQNLNEKAVSKLIDPYMKVGIWLDTSQYRSMEFALKKFISNNEIDGSKKFPELIQKMILGETKEKRKNQPCGLDAEILDTLNFNPSADQKQAIRSVVDHTLSIIQGPPGTGKSNSIYGIVKYMSCLNEKMKICVVSVKNASCDNVMNIFQRTNGFKNEFDVMQLKGEYYRATRSNNKLCLSSVIDEEIENGNARMLLRAVSFEEYKSGLDNLEKHNGTKDSTNNLDKWFKREQILKNYIRTAFTRLQSDFIEDHVKVVISTFTSLFGHGRPGSNIRWDLIVNEEASCIIPPLTLMAIINLEPNHGKFVLVGDYKQLGMKQIKGYFTLFTINFFQNQFTSLRASTKFLHIPLTTRK